MYEIRSVERHVTGTTERIHAIDRDKSGSAISALKFKGMCQTRFDIIPSLSHSRHPDAVFSSRRRRFYLFFWKSFSLALYTCVCMCMCVYILCMHVRVFMCVYWLNKLKTITLPLLNVCKRTFLKVGGEKICEPVCGGGAESEKRARKTWRIIPLREFVGFQFEKWKLYLIRLMNFL